MSRWFNIRGTVRNIIRGGTIRGTVLRRDIDELPEPVVRQRFHRSQPKLYVGTDHNTAKQVADYAQARQDVPVDILIREVHHFFLSR